MHPVLFDIGGFEIHSYGAMGALGFVLGCGLVLWRSHRLGLDINRVADVIFGVAVAGLIGSRLVFLAQHPELVEGVADVFDLRGGGLVFYGSILFGLPVGLALMRWRGLPIWAVFDIFATGAPLAHGVSRIGCFLAGCCWGLPHDGPLAVTFPTDSQLAPGDVALYPVQLFESAALFTIAAVTNWLYPRRAFAGQVFGTYLMLYAFVRIGTETFRGDISRGFFLPDLLGQSLSFSQGISLTVALVAAVWLWRSRQAALADVSR